MPWFLFAWCYISIYRFRAEIDFLRLGLGGYCLVELSLNAYEIKILASDLVWVL